MGVVSAQLQCPIKSPRLWGNNSVERSWFKVPKFHKKHKWGEIPCLCHHVSPSSFDSGDQVCQNEWTGLITGAGCSHVRVLHSGKEEMLRGPTFSSSINQEISEYLLWGRQWMCVERRCQEVRHIVDITEHVTEREDTGCINLYSSLWRDRWY